MHTGYIGKHRDPVVVIILSIVTCGIYALFWLYTVMEDVNRTSGQQRIDSTMLLILSIICAPVMWFALYKVDQEMMRLAGENGTTYNSNFVLWLLLTFVCGVGTYVAMYQLTNTYNEIWARRQGGGTQQFQ